MRVDVEGPAATDAEIDPARGDHRLGDGDDFALGKRCGVGPDPRAKSLTLRDIEHGEAFEKRHRARRSTVARRPLGFALRNELVGIDHGRAALTLADIAARLQCLTEGQPALGRPPSLEHRAPQTGRAKVRTPGTKAHHAYRRM